MENPILREWLTRPGGLASRLSAMRVRAGLSGSALAKELGWVHTKVSRIQNGRQIPTAEEIRVWAKACNAADEADDLVDLLEQVSTQRLTWRHWLAAAGGRVQGAYNELFRQSTKVEMFENESIPGVLQTPGYATALLGYLLPLHGVDRALVDDEVTARMERGRYLHDPAKQFDLLMTETALLSSPASADVLATQIESVLRLSELPNVRIGVVPLRPGLPVAIVSPFSCTIFAPPGSSRDVASTQRSIILPRGSGRRMSSSCALRGASRRVPAAGSHRAIGGRVGAPVS